MLGSEGVSIPQGSFVMHIGVHKTGTTAIQSSLAQVRDKLREQGISYPGRLMAHREIASSAMGRPLGWRTEGARPPQPGLWDETVRDAKNFEGTTVISSEFLAEADDDTAARMITAIGPDRTHVIITLRNFARILPSAWQQNLKSGMRSTYEDWLRKMLFDPETMETTVFWKRHRHDRVVNRWVSLLGPERVHVVVVDERDRGGIYRSFESLLNLPDGFLQPTTESRENRSFTAAEAEFLRRLNLAVSDLGGWARYRHQVHDRMEKGLVEGRVPAPGESRLQTPQWALDRAAEFAVLFADAIEASGAQVIGDVEVLRAAHQGLDADAEAADDVPIDAAVAAAVALLEAGGRVDARAPMQRMRRAARRVLRRG